VAAQAAGRPASFEELESRLLGGQKLQGALTAGEVQAILRKRGWEANYPLFTTGAGRAQSGCGPGWSRQTSACGRAARQAGARLVVCDGERILRAGWRIMHAALVELERLER
jgi:hypothetical protein